MHPTAARKLDTVVDNEKVAGLEQPKIAGIGDEVRLHDGNREGALSDHHPRRLTAQTQLCAAGAFGPARHLIAALGYSITT
jgi:hypothetical protein